MSAIAANPVAAPVIVATDLVKDYRMGAETVHALNGVTLSIARNEYVAIMGASGSGKSTLMNIVGCLDRPTSGEYRLAGQVVSGLGETEPIVSPAPAGLVDGDRVRVGQAGPVRP